MKDKIEQANQILAWMARKVRKSSSKCPCIRGVKSTELTSYLKRYHSNLTEWIKALEMDDRNDDEKYVWIETGLLEQLVELYMDVEKMYDRDLQRFVVVEY